MAVLQRICTLPRGENDNDAHACELNYITVQNKIIVKILPVNKFTTLKFLSLLPSMNGQFFLDYHVLLCNIKHAIHCHLSPLAEKRIPRRLPFMLIFWS